MESRKEESPVYRWVEQKVGFGVGLKDLQMVLQSDLSMAVKKAEN